MKASNLSIACILTVIALPACKPVAEGDSAVPAAEISPVSPAEIQPPVAANAMVQIPVSGTDAMPHLLAAKEVVTGTFSAPQDGNIRAVGLQIGNFGGTSDGKASLKVCLADDCRETAARIAGSTDNDYLQFQLPADLRVEKSAMVAYTFTRVEGSQPFAVWTYPAVTNGELTLPDGTKAPRDTKIALTY